MKKVIPSFVFRRRAWVAIKPLMQVLVVLGLLTILPGLIGDVATLLTKANPNSYIQEPAEEILKIATAVVESEADLEALEAGMAEAEKAYLDAWVLFAREKGAIVLGTALLSLLLGPVFAAPLYGALLDALRKKDVTLANQLPRMRLGPRVLLVNLWMELRVFVWLLPGVAVSLLAAFMPSASAMMIVMVAGMAVMLVLGLRAALHYCYAPIIAVDRPDLSINGCIRESWGLMRQRKMEYFLLRISFIGWELLISMIGLLAVSQMMLVICQALSMMAGLLLTIYLNGAIVAFYDTYACGGMEQFAPEASDYPGGDLN